MIDEKTPAVVEGCGQELFGLRVVVTISAPLAGALGPSLTAGLNLVRSMLLLVRR